MMAFAAVFMESAASFADDRMIPNEQLPAQAQSFIRSYFPKATIVCTLTDGFLCSGYETYLLNGTEIKFDRNGNWDKVDCDFTAVPSNLVPTRIARYVRTTYPEQMIVEIDKRPYGFEVGLSNRTELKFNMNEELIKMDF